MCRNDRMTHVTQGGQYAGMAANPGGSMLRNGGSMVAGMIGQWSPEYTNFTHNTPNQWRIIIVKQPIYCNNQTRLSPPLPGFPTISAISHILNIYNSKKSKTNYQNTITHHHRNIVRNHHRSHPTLSPLPHIQYQ